MQLTDSLKGIYHKLDDASWALLDKLYKIPGLNKVVDFIDAHNIPAIIFPLAVIILIIALLFLFTASAPIVKCGDGLCSSGEASTCPEDCGAAGGNKVIVNIIGDVKDRINVWLYDEDNDIAAKQAAQKNEFEFVDVEAEKIYVKVINSKQREIRAPSSGTEKVGKETVISVTLPQDFFDYGTESATYGSVQVSVKDTGGTSVSATVSLKDSSNTAVNTNVGSDVTFSNVKAGEYYYLVAAASGHETYDGLGDKFLVEAGKTKQKTITLTKLTSAPGATGTIKVCVSDESGPVLNGLVRIYDITGTPIVDNDLRGCVIERGGTKDVGCLQMAVPAGGQYYAVIVGSNCANSLSNIVSVAANELVTINMDLYCNLTGSVNVMVLGTNNTVLTENASITVFADDTQIPGSNSDNTLVTYENVTERVLVPLNESVYAWARSVPGYADTRSQGIVLEDDEETVTIVVHMVVDTNGTTNSTVVFSNMQVFPNPVSVDSTVAASTKVYDNSTNTELNSSSSVSVNCRYWNGTQAAAYYATGEVPNSWMCNLTTPVESGSYEMNFEAIYNNVRTQSSPIVVRVVDYEEGDLAIIRDAADATRSPARLKFHITRKSTGTPVTHLTSSLVVTDRNGQIISTENLSKCCSSEGSNYYDVHVSVPFPGTYTADVFAATEENNTVYNGSTTVQFTVFTAEETYFAGWTASNVRTLDQIFSPRQSFYLMATLMFDELPLTTEDVDAIIDFTSYGLIWNEEQQVYRANNAINDEAAYLVTFTVQADPSKRDEIFVYVIDTTQPSASCPVADYICDNIEEVRGCKKLFDQFGITYEAMLTCAENGMETTRCGNSVCEEDECAEGCADCTLEDCINDTVCSPAVGENSENSPDDCCSQTLACDDLSTELVECSVACNTYYGCNSTHCNGVCDEGEDSNIDPSGCCARNCDDRGIDGYQCTPACDGINNCSLSYCDGTCSETESVVNAPADCCSLDIYCDDVSTEDAIECAPACQGINNCDIEYCAEDCRGDVNGDGQVDQEDITAMEEFLDYIQDVGICSLDEEDEWMKTCGDVNNDTNVTQEDLMCLQLAFTEGMSFDECDDCMQYDPYEICNNELDDNCDGQIDRQTCEWKNGEFIVLDNDVTGERGEMCSGCATKEWVFKHIPCDMKLDSTGSGGPHMNCRVIGWERNWFFPEEGCNGNRYCEYKFCGKPTLREENAETTQWNSEGKTWYCGGTGWMEWPETPTGISGTAGWGPCLVSQSGSCAGVIPQGGMPSVPADQRIPPRNMEIGNFYMGDGSYFGYRLTNVNAITGYVSMIVKGFGANGCDFGCGPFVSIVDESFIAPYQVCFADNAGYYFGVGKEPGSFSIDDGRACILPSSESYASYAWDPEKWYRINFQWTLTSISAQVIDSNGQSAQTSTTTIKNFMPPAPYLLIGRPNCPVFNGGGIHVYNISMCAGPACGAAPVDPPIPQTCNFREENGQFANTVCCCLDSGKEESEGQPICQSGVPFSSVECLLAGGKCCGGSNPICNPEIASACSGKDSDGGEGDGGDTEDDNTGGSCFLAGTQITLVDGSTKSIEDINIGDLVLSYNGKNTVPAIVLKVFEHPNNKKYLLITTENNRELKVTGEHLIFNGADYQSAGSLKIGDKLFIKDSSNHLIQTRIKSIESKDGASVVYNLETSVYHNYFANGVLVHNAKETPPVR